MPTCPKCKADIDHLNAFVAETVKYEIYLDELAGHEGLNWGRAEPTEGSASFTEFSCPKCGEAIFTNDQRPPCPECGADSRLVNDLATEHIETVVVQFLKGVEQCPHGIPIPLRGKANACLAGGSKTEDYPGGQFCHLLESVGKCKLEG